MKDSSGRGRKTTNQGMGRVWEEYFRLPICYAKSGRERKKILKFLLYLTKNSKFSAFLKPQGGGRSEKISFRPIGGVKNCPREGDCVLGGQPMGIPPPSPPLAHLWPQLMSFGEFSLESRRRNLGTGILPP